MTTLLNQSHGKSPSAWRKIALGAVAPIAAAIALSVGRTLLDDFTALSSTGFLPTGVCFGPHTALIWFKAGLDAGICCSSFVLAGQFVYLWSQRIKWLSADGKTSSMSNTLLGWFCMLVVGLGAIHGLDVVTLWSPYYYTDFIARTFTAIASVGSAIALGHEIPRLSGAPTLSNLQDQFMEMKAYIAAIDAKDRKA